MRAPAFEYEVVTLDENNLKVDVVTPLSATPDANEPNAFTFVLPPDTRPRIEVSVECRDGETAKLGTGLLMWRTFAVTKIVSGPAAADAGFTVHVACGSSTVINYLAADLDYGEAGGVRFVYAARGVFCRFAETVDGGASSITIDPTEQLALEPATYPVIVTNTFAPEPSFTG